MIAALFVETGGAYFGLPELTRGTKQETLGSIPGRGRSWRIRHASAGGSFGPVNRYGSRGPASAR